MAETHFGAQARPSALLRMGLQELSRDYPSLPPTSWDNLTQLGAGTGPPEAALSGLQGRRGGLWQGCDTWSASRQHSGSPAGLSRAVGEPGALGLQELVLMPG